MVVIVDDDELIRGSLGGLVKEEAGLPAVTFASAEEFLTSGDEKRTACLIVDIRMRCRSSATCCCCSCVCRPVVI